MAYTLEYEAMQRDMEGEIRKLLSAIGASVPEQKTRLVCLVIRRGESEIFMSPLSYECIHAEIFHRKSWQ